MRNENKPRQSSLLLYRNVETFEAKQTNTRKKEYNDPQKLSEENTKLIVC
jgi:hypothetical protein